MKCCGSLGLVFSGISIPRVSMFRILASFISSTHAGRAFLSFGRFKNFNCSSRDILFQIFFFSARIFSLSLSGPVSVGALESDSGDIDQ